MRSRVLKGLAVVSAFAVAAVLIVALVAYVVFIRPWTAMPDESPASIDERWRQVERWAASPADCDEPPGALDAVETKVELAWTAVGDRFGTGSGYPRLGDEPAPGRDAAREALLRWRADGAGLGPVEDGARVREPIALLHLGQLVLASAEDADEPGVDEVLALGAELRRCGSLVEAAVGFALVDEVIDWADARQVIPPTRFARHRPDADELFGALARDAVLTHELAARELSRAQAGERIPGVPRLVPALVDVERELRVLQVFHADLLFAADAAGRDLVAMRAIYTVDDVDELPRSLLLRVAYPGYDGVIRSVGETIGRCDTWLAEAARPADQSSGSQ